MKFKYILLVNQHTREKRRTVGKKLTALNVSAKLMNSIIDQDSLIDAKQRMAQNEQ